MPSGHLVDLVKRGTMRRTAASSLAAACGGDPVAVMASRATSVVSPCTAVMDRSQPNGRRKSDQRPHAGHG